MGGGFGGGRKRTILSSTISPVFQRQNNGDDNNTDTNNNGNSKDNIEEWRSRGIRRRKRGVGRVRERTKLGGEKNRKWEEDHCCLVEIN